MWMRVVGSEWFVAVDGGKLRETGSGFCMSPDVSASSLSVMEELFYLIRMRRAESGALTLLLPQPPSSFFFFFLFFLLLLFFSFLVFTDQCTALAIPSFQVVIFSCIVTSAIACSVVLLTPLSILPAHL